MSQASTSSSPASSRPDDTLVTPGLAEPRRLYGPDTKYHLSDQALREVLDLSRQCIRPDLIEYLQGALYRWKTAGFWLQAKLSEPAAKGTGREKLFNAYSYICKLENQIGDDQIRNRVAVVMLHTAYEQACKEWRHCSSQKPKGKGRGDATTVIDDILEELHGDCWHQGGRQQQLRSRFHDKKRFGKRWIILTRRLGMSILIACSPKVASAV